jgi:hypothetical protein
VHSSSSEGASANASALKPWQFFLLAGMLGATAAVVVATGQSMGAIVALSVTVVAASMVGLAAYRMLLPFVSPQAVLAAEVSSGRLRAALEREKTLVLRAIKDLEFDRSMGKVAPADFDEMSGRLRARALDLIQQLDGSGAYRARIEEELAARLKKAPALKTADKVTAGSLTPETASAAVPAVSGSTLACAECGTQNDPDARFCKACGARMAVAQ